MSSGSIATAGTGESTGSYMACRTQIPCSYPSGSYPVVEPAEFGPLEGVRSRSHAVSASQSSGRQPWSVAEDMIRLGDLNGVFEPGRDLFGERDNQVTVECFGDTSERIEPVFRSAAFFEA